uniref:Progestin and adipoQ receptor family member 5 n=1 Tax=Eptatretus burgeri TaxID=7764 RepID=A0A8C4PWH2_EPTBU
MPAVIADSPIMLTFKLPRLLNIHQVPKDFREEYIISGYRQPKSSALDCVRSIFQLTNETLNIWTHLLPTWYFVWRIIILAQRLDFQKDAYTWPLLVYLAGCCVYLLASSCAHTFSTMSLRIRHMCFFFDYAALSFYSLGSAVGYGAYTIPDDWLDSTFHHCYIPLAILNSIVCSCLSCYTRLGLPFLHYSPTKLNRLSDTENPKVVKLLRTVAFAYPYFFDHIPLYYRVCLCAGDGCTSNDAIPLHHLHMFFASLTGFFFASHFPECLAPGRFDLIGHSHQLFHTSAVFGTYFQLEALVLDLEQRRESLRISPASHPCRGWPGGAIAFAAFANLLVAGTFSLAVVWLRPRGGDKKTCRTRWND